MLKTFLHINLAVAAALLFQNQEVKSIHLSGHAQGTTWNVTYFSADSAVLKQSLDSIFNSIDSSLSIYKPYSTIVAFNKSERGIKVDNHLRNIVKLSKRFTSETAGLSDITIGPLTKAYGFGADKLDKIPTDLEIRKLLSCVGSKNVVLKNDSLIKLKPCIQIDVNGIAQGYTVDVIAAYLDKKGVADYIVEVGGELRSRGLKRPALTPFQVGIEAPSDDEFEITPMQQIISLNNGSLTTSGNYRKYFESNGKKHSHIIDPRTGLSVDNELISVSVYAKDATTADALDNALMLMGVNRALKFVERRKDLAAFLIYKDSGGKIRDTASSRFQKLIVQHTKTK